MGNQVNEELQDYRLEVNLITVLAELPRIRIYEKVIETVNMMLAHDRSADRSAYIFEYSIVLGGEQYVQIGPRVSLNPDRPGLVKTPSNARQALVKRCSSNLNMLFLRPNNLLYQQRRTT